MRLAWSRFAHYHSQRLWTNNSSAYMEAYRQKWIHWMTSNRWVSIWSESLSTRLTDSASPLHMVSCAIYSGQTPSKSLEVKETTICLFTIMSEDVHISSGISSTVQPDNVATTQHVSSSNATIYYLSSEHMKPRMRGINHLSAVSLL